MMEAGGAFHGTFKYDADLYDAAAAARMAGHLRTLAEAIVADPRQRVSDLPLLTPAEHRQLAQWNATRVDYNLDVTLHRLCEAQAARTPEQVAVVCEGRELTYRELHARANQLAHALCGHGVGPDVPVGICAERSLELVVGLLGILKAGGFYVPLDPGYPAERLAFMLEDSGVPVLLTQQHLAAVVGETPARVLCLDADWDEVARQPDTAPDCGAGADTRAYMIYTSGSTGRPKGAMNTHRNVVNRLLWMQDEYRLGEADRVLQKTPFSFDVSVWEFFWPLMTGARMVLAKPGGHRDNAYLAGLIAEHGITTLHFVPPMLQLFVQEPGAARCTSLTRVICSGEALPFELQQSFFARFDAELHNLYGPTECAIDVTYWACRRDATRTIVPIGRPIANTQIHVLDRKLQPVPAGIPGELHIAGTNVGLGYHRRPELSAEKFIRDPFQPGGRLYKSGDLARWLDDGSIEYLGRLDHQVKIRGFRIELDEIRAVLDQHPGVRESIVVVHEEAERERRLAAYFVAGNENVSADALRAYLKEKLPEFMVPSFLVPLAALPLSPNGKIDRRALPAPASVRREPAQRPPRNDAERRLVGIWEQVLDVRPVGVEDNFFDLGGDSLMAVKLMALVGQAFERRLPLPTLFQHPSVEQLAAHLGERGDARWDPLVEVQPGTAGTPPLFCMPGGGGNVLYFYRLARTLGAEQPFYALQSVGLDGVTEPYTRIEDMAARYLQAIRGVQPHGPYRLAGHCFGALVAFETAQQLRRQGEAVALVAVFDSPAPVPDQPAAPELDDAEWLLRIVGAIEQASGKSLGVEPEALRALDAEGQLDHLKQKLQAVGFLPPEAEARQVRGMLEVYKGNQRAGRSYFPHDAQPLPIALFRAVEPYADYDYGPHAGEPPERSTLGWERWADGPVAIELVPGNHLTMLFEPHVATLAARLAARIAPLPR
jgi:amino acid adenylation domain-containing protein